MLQLIGGAIGSGIPVATGAAIAAPERPVIALEGDGSAMYTVQALWTQAREQLNVTTVVFANQSSAVLKDELGLVGATAAGPMAKSMPDLRRPSIDWVGLSRSLGVPGVAVETGPTFDTEFKVPSRVADPTSSRYESNEDCN